MNRTILRLPENEMEAVVYVGNALRARQVRWHRVEHWVGPDLTAILVLVGAVES